jgi:inorganic pyrophosphatase
MSELYCCVETPKGSVLGDGQALQCPGDYGYFPQTVAGLGRPLKVIVCASAPHSRGGTVDVKPIGLLRTQGRRGYDEVVLCVARDDPAWTSVDRVQDLPGRLLDEIQRFISTRPVPQEVVGWCSRDDALTAIDDAAARWAATVNGRA